MPFLKRFGGGRVRAYLAADRVAAVREHGLLRRRVECAWAQVTPDETGAPPWAPALQSLSGLIADRGWRGLPIDVAVSSEFVRLALIPGIRGQLTTLEIQGLAHGVFGKVLGEAAADWSVRYCAAGRSTVLGAAAEKSLLAALADFARSSKGALRSVAPLWSCAVNWQRFRLRRRSAWLVLAESRAAAYGLLDRGHWRVVRAKSLDAGRGIGVARLLERESRYLGTATRDVIVVGDPPAGEPFAPGWKVEPVPVALARLGVLPAECRPAALAGV
jgi:hypothetical protein